MTPASGLFGKRGGRICVADIQRAVCSRYRLHLDFMRNECRAHMVSHPRQVAMYLSRKLTKASLPEIGRRFGGRDHTTVIHAIGAVKKRIEQDPELETTILAIKRDLEAE